MIRWIERLLYLSLFLVLIFTMNLWIYTITLPYVGAILVLIVLGLLMIGNKEAWEELNDLYLMDVSGYTERESYPKEI